MSNLPPPPPPGGGAPPPPPGGGAPPPPPGGGTPPPFGGPPPAQTGMPPMANFGQRFGAYIIDALITGAMLWIPILIAGAIAPKEDALCRDFDGNIESCRVVTDAGGVLVIIVGLLAFVGTLAYWGIMEGKGQTLGKKALNIRTADIATGQPIGTGRAIGRYFARIPSGFVCALGYFWMLWDDNSQTWHDKIVSTVVVDA